MLVAIIDKVRGNTVHCTLVRDFGSFAFFDIYKYFEANGGAYKTNFLPTSKLFYFQVMITL